jgi:hypothetical protein
MALSNAERQQRHRDKGKQRLAELESAAALRNGKTAGKVPAEPEPTLPHLGEAIVEYFGGGRWHHLRDIAAGVEQPEDHVARTLDAMVGVVANGAVTERRKSGKSYSYRIFRTTGQAAVGFEELITKLGPILEGLKVEGKKEWATVSPPTLAGLAIQLQRQLDEWTAPLRLQLPSLPNGEIAWSAKAAMPVGEQQIVFYGKRLWPLTEREKLTTGPDYQTLCNAIWWFEDLARAIRTETRF